MVSTWLGEISESDSTVFLTESSLLPSSTIILPCNSIIFNFSDHRFYQISVVEVLPDSRVLVRTLDGYHLVKIKAVQLRSDFELQSQVKDFRLCPSGHNAKFTYCEVYLCDMTQALIVAVIPDSRGDTRLISSKALMAL